MAEGYDSDGDRPPVGGAGAGVDNDLFALVGLVAGIAVVAGWSGYLGL